MVLWGQLPPRCCRTMFALEQKAPLTRELRSGRESRPLLGIPPAGLAPPTLPLQQQETRLRLDYPGAFRLFHVRVPTCPSLPLGGDGASVGACQGTAGSQPIRSASLKKFL